MSLRTDLGRARGLGAARHGTAHWWAERLTALALVPLVLWFVAAVVPLTGAPHAAVAAWLAEPVTAVLMVLLIAVLFHHAQLGVQTVVEDYVHAEGLKLGVVVAVKFAAALLAAASGFAVLKIALGAG